MSSTQQLLLGEGAGGGAAPVYIEDVFSTYLYTGTGANQTITNGINLSGKGGLVWLKSRSSSVYNHFLMDTTRGVQSELSTNNADFANTANVGSDLTAFTSTGFTLGPVDKSGLNNSGSSQVSWTFREEPKFFDVVSYTGTGANRTIAHNLGSVPGCIIVKQIAPNSTNWQVYHRSLANTQYMVLNDTAAVATGATRWNSTTPTASVFSLGTATTVNDSGSTYVAYLFAHDAGGFGAAGTDNVISCGSFTPSSGVATVNLGYEPQWLLWKKSSGADGWSLIDNMRGWTANSGSQRLYPNTTDAEESFGAFMNLTSTGFATASFGAGDYIYIAIRRGPMKVPTSGTSVFAPVVYAGTDTTTTVTTNIVPSLTIVKGSSNDSSWYWTDMLRGSTKNLRSNTTGAQQFDGTVTPINTGFILGVSNGFTNAGVSFISYSMLRAPQFFDEVCYTGTGSATTFTHNLTVVPELMIVKRTSAVADWAVYLSALGNNKALNLNLDTGSSTTTTYWNSTTPTSSVFTVGTATQTNGSGSTYVAYLFATCAGVSKVGSYTGTGSTQTINCGFTGGARFVMIKRADSIGNWPVFDTARGMVSGDDPVLFIDFTGPEEGGVTVFTVTTGFQVSGTTQVNASGGTYIFLAIA